MTILLRDPLEKLYEFNTTENITPKGNENKEGESVGPSVLASYKSSYVHHYPISINQISPSPFPPLQLNKVKRSHYFFYIPTFFSSSFFQDSY